MYINNYLLDVLAVISIAAYVLKAWNSTTLPIIFSQIAAKLGLIKKNNLETLSQAVTREDWYLWSTVVFPDWAVSLLNCSICQTPYVSAIFSWLILYKFGGFSFSYTFLGWCLSLITVVKLQNNVATPSAAVANPNSGLKTVTSLKKHFELPQNLEKHNGPLKFIKEEQTSKVVPVNNKELVKLDTSIFNGLTNTVEALSAAKQQAELMMQDKVNEVKASSEKKIREAGDKYRLWQQEMGIETQQGPNGELIVVKYNNALLQIMKFFKPDEPCFFEGCEDLRRQHALELAEKGADCPDCQKSELQRKYMVLVKRAIEAFK